MTWHPRCPPLPFGEKIPGSVGLPSCCKGICVLTFPYPLNRGEDPVTGLPVLGFEHRGHFIFEPYRSPDLTRDVDPLQAYELPHAHADRLVKLNKLLVKATRAALDAGCAVIQNELGLAMGPIPDLQLGQDAATRPVVQTLADYVLREVTAGRRRKG